LNLPKARILAERLVSSSQAFSLKTGFILSACRVFYDILTNITRNAWLGIDHPFDYQFAMDRLRHYAAPRDKLRRLCEDGTVVQIKKGLYIPAAINDSKAIDPFVLAALIYGPSYVSHETALAHYGLIPERVEEITCTATKRSRTFDTPLGKFRYFPANERAFGFGYRLEKTHGGSWFLAEPEKALCDRVSRVKGLSAVKDVASLLIEDFRIEPDDLKDFRLPLLREAAERYRRKNVRALSKWFEKEFR
jgi:hypothetical protein